jgi:hypothetical protein
MILASGIAALVNSVANADQSNNKKFLGKWSGFWDGKWPMSLDVTAVQGSSATVDYTWPDGHAVQRGTIKGEVLTLNEIVLTLTAPNKGVAVGTFPTAQRTAQVSR